MYKNLMITFNIWQKNQRRDRNKNHLEIGVGRYQISPTPHRWWTPNALTDTLSNTKFLIHSIWRYSGKIPNWKKRTMTFDCFFISNYRKLTIINSSIRIICFIHTTYVKDHLKHLFLNLKIFSIISFQNRNHYSFFVCTSYVLCPEERLHCV